jgi:hypothetical protein
VTDFHPGSPLVLATGPDDDGVAVLTLNRPEKKNALSIALREEAVAILGRLADDEALRVLIITGSGGCFSAGFDLREFAVTEVHGPFRCLPGDADTRPVITTSLSTDSPCLPSQVSGLPAGWRPVGHDSRRHPHPQSVIKQTHAAPPAAATGDLTIRMKWLRRISVIIWIFTWRIIYLEIFRWHHMTKSLRFNPPPPLPGTDIRPKAGAPLIAVCVGAVAAPLVFVTATVVERVRGGDGGTADE